MNSEIQSAVSRLSSHDDGSLYAKLGYYSSEFSKAPGLFNAPGATVAVDTAHAGAMDDIIELGKKILSRWNVALYELACGSKGDPDTKRAILNALNLKSPDAVAAAITGVLISYFSVGPAVAAIVGVLLGRVLLPAGGQAVCEFWKERLAPLN